jgi:hypothetical protein
MRMREYDSLSSKEIENLEQEIDLEFRSKILKPREKKIVDFLVKVQNCEFEYRTTGDTKEIKVISLYYYANSPLSFIFVQPCYAFYSDSKTINRPELHSDDYTYEELEKIAIEILAKNNIDYTEFTEDDEAEIYDFWDNDYRLVKNFLIECWNKAKLITQTKLIGFLDASNYSGGTYDLDNGYSLFDNKIEIEPYLKNKGIIIIKDKERV